MNRYPLFFLGFTIAASLSGFESEQLQSVAQKFALETPDEQYHARLELNQLVDEATGPDSSQAAMVNQHLTDALTSDQTPREAKKYILRALSKTGTAENVPALITLLNGDDPLLKEEARRAIELIPGQSSVNAIEEALRRTADPREQIGLINSLVTLQATRSLPLLESYLAHPEEALSREAAFAIAKIGTSAAKDILYHTYLKDIISRSTKEHVGHALLYCAPQDRDLAKKVEKSSPSQALRFPAIKALMIDELNEGKSDLLEASLASEERAIRQFAMQAGLNSDLPALRRKIAQSIGTVSAPDRFVILSNIHLLKPTAEAEQIAARYIDSEDNIERIVALRALGQIGGKSAFETVLRTLDAREPHVRLAAGTSLAEMKYAGGEKFLLRMLEGDSSDDRILAIKALEYRYVDRANERLIQRIGKMDKASTQEALKRLVTSATQSEFEQLCGIARKTTEQDLRKLLNSLCTRIAERLDTEEARALATELKID
jgi:HEAT repeat protein